MTAIAGNWSEKNSYARARRVWPRAGEEGRSLEPKTGIPGGGSMEGMHRRSRWHGSPTGVGSR